MIAPFPAVAALPKVKNVLVLTDLSSDTLPVLPYARQIAITFGATLHLCHIHPEVPLASGLAAPRLYEAEGKESAEHLAALRRSPDLKEMEPKLILASGNIPEEMRKLIAENRIDLIMISTHGRTGLAKMVLGSTAEEICRVATCPIFTVNPSTGIAPQAAFKNILFATNLSDASKKALPYIAVLAGSYGSRVTVLNVVAQGQKNAVADSMRKAMAGEFGPALGHLQPEFMVASGNVAETVLKTAQEKEAGLIVLGIRNAFRPGILIERTAYRIMAGAHSPVLTVP